MTDRQFKIITWCAAIAFSLMCWFIVFSAFAATVWNEQTGRYYKYDTTPKNITDSAYKYILTTDIETAPKAWVKLPNAYIKYTTVNGGAKYAEEVIVAQPPANDCIAFMCVDDFGITFDLTKNTVLHCPKVKVTKEQIAMAYESAKTINGVPACPSIK